LFIVQRGPPGRHIRATLAWNSLLCGRLRSCGINGVETMLGWRTDVRVRPAKVADAARLTTVFAETWRGAYVGIIPHDQLEGIIRRRNKGWWTSAIRAGDSLLVVEQEGTVVGYATFGAARGRGRHQGEIFELYISPVYQGVGLGEHLFEACRARLDARGLKGLVVWALSDNSAATDFYWRRGGRPFKAIRERFGQTELAKVGFGWA
jgi:ribosomal protein S18 acetylase RimI-like enzyme